MLPRRSTQETGRSLIGEYAALVEDAVLRQRTRVAEQDARIQAHLVSKFRSEFLANMSHELRTPLNTVMGFSKMMADHAIRPLKDQDIVDYSRTVHEAASQLLSVINDILDMSRIQAGRYVLDQVDAEVDEILRSCVMGFRPQAAAAGVTLTEAIASGLAPVRGEPAKLRQIVAKLLSNAIKFTPRGGTVTVSATNESDMVAIVVHDTGIGMSEEDIAIAMTPFGQVDGSHARWREGTGLGLPIANALVQLHEGKMSIRSTPGSGTEISILLPHQAGSVAAA
jgi:two-component system cell cycle sensor histidine kinase PleC